MQWKCKNWSQIHENSAQAVKTKKFLLKTQILTDLKNQLLLGIHNSKNRLEDLQCDSLNYLQELFKKNLQMRNNKCIWLL